MGESLGNWIFGCLAGYVIAGLTFFFSSRPRLFVRVFVPREDWRGALRAFVRDPQFGRGMRLMSALQFALASVMGVAGLWLRFR